MNNTILKLLSKIRGTTSNVSSRNWRSNQTFRNSNQYFKFCFL